MGVIDLPCLEMFPLLVLINFLSPTLADPSCVSLQETKKLLKENEMKMRAEMEARLEALEVKLEEEEAKLAVLESSQLLDAPQVVMCAYQDLWMQEDSPISFDEFLTNFHNAEGDGALDLTTGTFTAMNPGFYSITFGGDVGTGPGLYTNIYLYKNNEKVYASRLHLEDRRDSGGDIITQASRSLVLELAVGDHLQLQADLFFNGSIRDLTYCIVLVASL